MTRFDRNTHTSRTRDGLSKDNVKKCPMNSDTYSRVAAALIMASKSFGEAALAAIDISTTQFHICREAVPVAHLAANPRSANREEEGMK